MIEQLQIRNFQCYPKLSIEFDKYVTTIIGPSDVGKSSIIRALRWACTNIPAGDAFIQDGKERCGVRLKVDGKIIERTKGKSENNYKLNGRAYKSFGSNVPEPIANFLNLSSVTWQGQHDSPFWLSESAGQVGRNLNAVVNLEVMDAVLLVVNRLVTKNKTKLELAKERLQKARDDFDGVAWINEAADDMGELEVAHACYRSVEASFARLQPMCEEAVGSHARAETLKVMAAEIWSVFDCRVDVERLSRKVDALRTVVEEAKCVEVQKVPDLSELESLRGKVDGLRGRVWMLNKLMDGVLNAMEDVADRNCTVEKACVELLKKMGGRCPLCGAVQKGDVP